VLERHGVRQLFTLCGGHISPILVEAKRLGIGVLDTRDEAAAAFAADAVSRLTGTVGVAAVTAGPGVTNAVTAVKNAQLAQSPLLLLGGATATLLRNRGALQDIDQMALMAPHVKFAASVERLRDLEPVIERALAAAVSDVPGPVFVECPVDLLYDESLVRKWYADATPKGKGLGDRAVRWYIGRHATGVFADAGADEATEREEVHAPSASRGAVARVSSALARAERPLMVLGSQVVADAARVAETAEAVARLGVPVYLAGGARGLLGPAHPLQMRHHRRQALRESDCVLLAGVPCDFRLDYGRHIRRGATYVAVNRDAADLTKNRRPTHAVHAEPGGFLRALAATTGLSDWIEALSRRDREREAEIDSQAARDLGLVNPVRLCREIDRALDDDSVVIADGGDFVGTAAYTVRPRRPLSWLDPGPFGTLGVGGGFALGAKAVRPTAEVWILYGDGSCAYSLAEFDSFARQGLAVIAVVGNDASWAQIARDQVEILGDDVGTALARTDYHRVAEGYGAKGLEVKRDADVAAVLQEAKALARAGHPVLINAHLGKSEFRKGSLSI
jgi:acetolactate synthase-1/2/3 large subunit